MHVGILFVVWYGFSVDLGTENPHACSKMQPRASQITGETLQEAVRVYRSKSGSGPRFDMLNIRQHFMALDSIGMNCWIKHDLYATYGR